MVYGSGFRNLGLGVEGHTGIMTGLRVNIRAYGSGVGPGFHEMLKEPDILKHRGIQSHGGVWLVDSFGTYQCSAAPFRAQASF